MAYDPSDLRLPHWLLRLLDGVVRLEMPIAPGWRLGMTRPGVLLAGVLSGLWLAAFYSGNNLLYLCGAMLSALVLVSIWQGIRLLKSVPPLADLFPSSIQAGEPFVLRVPLQQQSTSTGVVDLQWFCDQMDVAMQIRLESASLLTGRLWGERRSLLHLDRQLLTTTAPLGLWKLSSWRQESKAWAILPRPMAWAESRFGGSRHATPVEGDELRDLRGYVPGDALSRIHWRKASLEMDQWSVKRFEQHDQEVDAHMLRVDLRLPDSVAAQSFEQLLGRAWYWVDARLRQGEQRIHITLGQKQFDLSLADQRLAFLMALAEASPQNLPAAGHGGVLLSLVESG